MKKNFWVYGLGLLLLLTTGIAQAAGSFEGEVDYHMIGRNNRIMDFVYMMKGNHLRVITRVNGKENVVIIDTTTHQAMVLLAAQKMYMNMDLSGFKAVKESTEGTFTKTGKTDVILGKNVEEWTQDSKRGHGSFWLASGMGSFMGFGGKPGDPNNSWIEVVKAKGLFPLKMDYTDTTGKNTTSMIATKIEEKPLDDGLFEVPSDYKKMDISGMMGGAAIGSAASGH